MNDVMERILTMSAQACVLILCIMLITRLTQKHISPRLRYALWLLPAVRLLLPLRFESALSLMRIAPEQTQTGAIAPHIAAQTPALPVSPATSPLPNAEITAAPAAQGAQASQTAQVAQSTPDIMSVLFFIWLIGIIAVLAYMLIVNVRFYTRVRRERVAIDASARPPVYRMNGIASPCLCGYFKPCILMNEAALKSESVYALVLRHELCHYRALDQWWALLRNICCAVHWFNPIVWWAAFQARADCELACDARVMKRFSQTQCERYGMALLAIIHTGGRVRGRSVADMTTSMTGGKRELKRRVEFIGNRPRALWLVAALVLVLAGVAGLAACSEGVAPEPEKAPQVPEETSPVTSATSPVPGNSIGFTAEPSPAPSAETPPTDAFSNRAGANGDVLLALYSCFSGVDGEAERSKSLLERGHLINIYAARKLGDGILALADFAYEGERFPDLFYIENGAVISRTYGTDPWSIHYTRLNGSTIVYGKSFAWDGGILASTHVEAAFVNGMTDTAPMPVTAGDDSSTTGFILVADGDTWLEALEIYDGKTFVTDDHNYQFQYDDITSESIFGRTRFMPMYTPNMWQRYAETAGNAAVTADGERAGLSVLYKETGVLPADIWRSNAHRIMPAAVTANAPISLEGLDVAAIEHIYWIDISLDDGTDEGMERCVSEPLGIADSLAPGSEAGYIWATPGAPGQYVFIIETADAYYATGFAVAQ